MILDPKYNDVKPKEAGADKKLVAGGYVCMIKGTEEKVSSTGKNMVVLYLDIVEGEFTNYFVDKPVRYYQLIEGEKSVAFFKGMIKAIENSNPRYSFDYNNPNNVTGLIGKKVGFIFGEEGRYYNGKYYVDVKPMYARSIETIREGKFSIPARKGDKEPVQEVKPVQDDDDFLMDVEGEDDADFVEETTGEVYTNRDNYKDIDGDNLPF